MRTPVPVPETEINVHFQTVERKVADEYLDKSMESREIMGRHVRSDEGPQDTVIRPLFDDPSTANGLAVSEDCIRPLGLDRLQQRRRHITQGPSLSILNNQLCKMFRFERPE